MKVVKMQTNHFWKGEIGLKGLVEDQAHTYQVDLYIQSGEVRDYSCSCSEGNSYRGMCAHGEALFAYYKEYARKMSQPPVHTSAEIHSMIREYTNGQVARIMAREEDGQIHLAPVLLLSREDVKVEFKIGRERLQILKDLKAFSRALEEGAYVEYGKNLGFHHCSRAFDSEDRKLLPLILELAQQPDTGRQAVLGNIQRDRFFSLMEGKVLEVQLLSGNFTRLLVAREDPKPVVQLIPWGRDGIQVKLKGIWEQEEEEERLVKEQAVFGGQRCLYLAGESRLYQCSQEFSEAMKPFLTLIRRSPSRQLLIGERDIPLFYARVIKTLQPFCRIEEDQVCLKDYEPAPLQAAFKFDARGTSEVTMEPCLSYGEFTFHPMEDENLPRSVCRDVPGEFQVSQLIHRYFRYKDPDGIHLVIRNDEEAVYRLLTEGIEEFRAMGQVYVSENLKKWQVLAPPKVRVDVNLSQGWLDLKMDAGDLSGAELTKILSAYSQKKKYYRLKSGEFLTLGEGGLYTVAKLAESLGVTKKEFQTKEIRLPAYRALYLDSVLKEGEGVAYYRDQLFKAVVRGFKSVEDSDYQPPAHLAGVLREYQKTGFRWLKTLDAFGFGGILADDMGLGKTLQVIALLSDHYENHPQEDPALIICPASLIYNWEHEIHRFAPKLTVGVVAGNAQERQQQLEEYDKNECPQILITSYDLLKRDQKLYQSREYRFQVIDEAQYIKNASTQSARAVKGICARTRFALTGTPVENRLAELWSIFDYLMPGFLFGSQYFRREYETPIMKGENQEALDRLRKITGPFILRRIKKDVLKELPDKLETVVFSGMEQEQRQLYAANEIQLKELLDKSRGDEFSENRFQILAGLMRLRQICCDPRLCYENYQGPSAKLDTCMDLVRRGVSGEHKILLFSQFTSMLDLIEERLKEEGIQCHKLVGATPKEERTLMAGAFQKDQVPVFLISLKAGGTGLNLTAADIVIHYDPWWNVAAQNQATDRSHRIGQEKQVTVFKLIARDTVEESILTLQDSKKRLSDQVVTTEGGTFGGLSRQDLLKILGPERNK